MQAPMAPPLPDAGDDRRLLDLFDPKERSSVANTFLRQVRSGAAATPEAVYRAAEADLRQRCARALVYHRAPWNTGDHWRESALRLAEQADLLARHREEGIAYGRWALAWEALPPEERERRKRDKGQDYARAAMDKRPATEKQVAYLAKMGYSGPIDSKAHASSLIDLYIRGQRVAS